MAKFDVRTIVVRVLGVRMLAMGDVVTLVEEDGVVWWWLLLGLGLVVGGPFHASGWLRLGARQQSWVRQMPPALSAQRSGKISQKYIFLPIPGFSYLIIELLSHTA